ncbi:hypothetical protein [Clostridium magnum]|uniref:hypothetical protein n=1 Tax=Clostridium magnum TaxID=33954 RepID=UPI0009119E6D|nr:hypothetical protein [Clostridium magnum]SHJ13484.1 hypothetical protein SAMN02745944_05416 [Clostridium magnum DSM 2767]
MERIYIFVQGVFLNKNKAIKSIYLTMLIIYLSILYKWRSCISIKYAYNILNSDIFTLSGVLAGFLFTGIGLIYTSNNKMISDLRLTNNFKLVNKIYAFSILNYVIVALIYLFKPLLVFDIASLDRVGTVYAKFIFIFLVTGIYLFWVANVMFLIALFILFNVLKSK